MPVELARRRLIAKPWGATDLAPWDRGADDGSRVGEIWYERSQMDATPPALLLKLLFTTERLSIQVHPDDDHAKAMGLPHGKTEAWYILHADTGAQVGLGLKRSWTARQLRQSALDGSIVRHILWRGVWAGDTVFVPAGTIHSIGPGLVVAEIQQRCDVTFRLIDPKGNRELHLDDAIAVAHVDMAPEQPPPRRLDDERMLLVSDSHFMLERLDLPKGGERSLRADQETWLLVIGGSGYAASFEVGPGTGLYAHSDQVVLRAGEDGMSLLVAYAGGGRAAPHLLRKSVQSYAKDASQDLAAIHSASPVAMARPPVGELNSISERTR